MYHTFKGIYIKSQYSDEPNATAEITGLLYEDIEMDGPTQVPIWVGPAQEADSAHACSLAWPEVPFTSCPPPPTGVRWANITLRNVTIRSPKQSPGLIYGNPKRPFENVLFENVVVTDPGDRPWGRQFYKCAGVRGIANGSTSSAPPCFHVSA